MPFYILSLTLKNKNNVISPSDTFFLIFFFIKISPKTDFILFQP